MEIDTKEAILLCDMIERYACTTENEEDGICNAYHHLSEKIYNVVEDHLMAEGVDAERRASLESYFLGLDIPVSLKLKVLQTPGHPEVDPR